MGRLIGWWWRPIAAEVEAIGRGPAPRVPVPVAVGVTAATVVVGNGVVLLQRRVGGKVGELLTMAAHPLLGAAGSAALVAAGWRRSDVGLRLADPRAVGALRRPAGVLLLALAGAAIATAVRGGSHDGVSDRITISRLVVGTALGEELIHRGLLFALWSATGRSKATVVVMNGLAFGAWHVAGAVPKSWPARIADVVMPAVPGTALFLWGRCRSKSVSGSWLLHLATNLPFLVVKLWSRSG